MTRLETRFPTSIANQNGRFRGAISSVSRTTVGYRPIQTAIAVLNCGSLGLNQLPNGW